MAGIIALILTGVGAILVAIGVVLSLKDRKRKLKQEGIQAEGTSGSFLEGLAKLAEALSNYPLGMQLIFIGVALMFAGGGVGGISAL